MTLLAMYVGVETCGLAGLIAFPVFVIVGKTLFFDGEGRKKKEKT